MKAAEASVLANKNAPVVAKRRQDFEAKEAATKKAIRHAERKAWRDKFEEIVRGNITSAVNNGKTESMTGISNTLKYPFHTFSDFKQYETFFEYKEDVKLVIRHLKRDGYEAVLYMHSYEVDDRAAYMNSGGECGSETVYWDSDIVLKVNW